jgi:hypothetical protein
MKNKPSKYFVSTEDMQPILPDVNPFYVEVKSKKGTLNKTSIASLLLTLPAGVKTFENHLHLINPEQALPFSNDMALPVQRYNMELQIKDRSKAFNKAASKYNGLEERSKKLEKEKIDIEGKIQKNQHRLQVSIIEVDAKRHELAASFTQRQNNKLLQQTTIKV